MKRVFLGLPVLPTATVLEDVYRRVRANAGQKRMEVNWVPLEKWHITVQFFGDMDEPRIASLIAALDESLISHKAFRLRISGMGCFPDDNHARVIWMGVQNSVALNEMVDKVRVRTAALGLPMESDYKPHLTIGRLRKQRSCTDLLSPFVRKEFAQIEVSGLGLYESRQHGPVRKYDLLHRFAFQGAVPLETQDI